MPGRASKETVLHTSSVSEASVQEARPFLKWAGGKQQLINKYEPYFPNEFNRYIEPFLGGGAVFFHLWNTGRIFEQAHLFDINKELITTYLAVRDEPEELIRLLAEHKKRHSKEYFYKIRDLDRQNLGLSPVEWAARTIYLNKTCYNGLFRVNSKGEFNVPMGSYKNPKILFKENLLAASRTLQNASLNVLDFQAALDLAGPGDFIYFDPPYDPLSKTANFTSYTAGNFSEQDQKNLAQVFERLSQKGCLCMLSNSHTPLVLDLYTDYDLKTIQANRAINSKAGGRGGIQEVLVLNYRAG
jgi:DNA adenine methylase